MSKGKGFLKVCGIIMIVGGGLSILLSIFSLAAAFGAFAIGLPGYGFGIIIGILAGIMELVCGIVGVVNCDKPEKAGVCLAFGVIVIVLSLIGQILVWVNAAAIGASVNFVSIITSLILPVLFIIGAVLNKKAA